ncbi:hypothetical protein CMV_010208 [Castanea mollissima]|uniref:Uncharacterized protein n=1 Tax=Castanea mollissima TaxID=60419 RepID=A0A8J4R5T3_9ROSI|nr:hypothetical protein CMV_010208 [Castanea mollissima]
MVVDVNDESCLQSEGHSKVSRVSDWRVWERGSDSGELELSAFTLGKRTGGALRVTKVNRRLRVRFPPPPTILSSLPLPTSRSVFFQTPSFTFPRSSGTTKNAVVFGDSDLQVTKPSSDLGLIVFPILLPELKHWKCRFYRKGIRFKSGRFGMIIWKKSFL